MIIWPGEMRLVVKWRYTALPFSNMPNSQGQYNRKETEMMLR